MSMEIQFLAWDWYKNVSGSKLNDVFFELDRYTRRKILVLFHRNKSSQNPCLKWDTLY
jgi:hypothetical protein